MTANFKPKRGYNQGMRPVAFAAQRIVRPIVKIAGAPVATLALDWHLVVGDMLRRYTYPDTLYFSKGAKINGHLKLLVMGTFSLELPYHKATIIERVNAYYGHSAVVDLSFKQVGTIPAQEVRPASTAAYVGNPLQDPFFEAAVHDLQDIQDPDLRHALAEMAILVNAPIKR